MSDVSKSHDISDLLGQYINRRPVEAVQLTDAKVLARVGRWITQSGGNCTWAAAYGPLAEGYAGATSNRMVIYRELSHERYSGGIGDWVVRNHRGEFSIVTSDQFQEFYEAVFRGEVTDD